MSKGNIRSMRFSDAIIEMIESQAGDSFTAKFEALVTRCMWELPQKEKELEYVQTRIRNEYARLDRIRRSISALEKSSECFKLCVEHYAERSKAAVTEIDRMIKDM